MTEAEARGRILVVEDEPDLREVYASLLAEAGHEVDAVGDGGAALRALERARFDVVLSDIVMPGINGIELLRAVRERDLDVPVILVTGSPRVETAVQAVDHGALLYLVKPVREENLLAAVERALRLHRLAQVKREALTHLGSGHLIGDRAGLEATFPRALETLWMAYQPIVRSGDERVFGYEALLRTAERAFPNPEALLEVAERLGRIHDLGRGVRTAVARFMSDGGAGETLFVNLHPLELGDDHLVDPGAPLSRKAGDVVLEITERVCLDGIPDVPGRIRALRRLGYRIAVDDLGAGYAGLATFAALEPDVVKLDMSLVRGADREPVKRKLIGSMTALCKDLGILVVAEGVETVEEKQVTLGEGCDLLQGYLFGRPRERAAS